MTHYGLLDTIKATGESVVSLAHLQQGEIATALLPPDTTFAIVLEGIQKGINDSFYETDTTGGPLLGAATLSSQGMVGRFVGYLSFTDTKVRIYQALDVNAAASGQLPENPVPQQPATGSLQLIFEDDLANVSLNTAQGEFVISNATQKVKLLQPYPISHLDGRFESSATGMQGGFSPSFKYMAAHGAQTGAAVKQSNMVGVIIILVIIVALVVVIALSKK